MFEDDDIQELNEEEGAIFLAVMAVTLKLAHAMKQEIDVTLSPVESALLLVVLRDLAG